MTASFSIGWVFIAPVVLWMLWCGACFAAGVLVYLFDLVIGENAFEGLTSEHIVKPIRSKINYTPRTKQVDDETAELCASLNAKYRYMEKKDA